MAKHKTREQWIKLFKKYETNRWDWNKYYEKNVIFIDKDLKGLGEAYKLKKARSRFKNKYKEWKTLDNIFMKNITNNKGRKKQRDDSDIPFIIQELNDEQKNEIINKWIKEQRDKKEKKKSSLEFKLLSVSLKSRIWKLHRTTFYKKSKKRLYKFDFAKNILKELHLKNKSIYGSRKLSILLKKEGINICDRTLRNYMKRWNIKTYTRLPKRKREIKNTNVKYKDIVRRNFNPKNDNIIATDVSYIPAKTNQRNVYLSVAISHKTKMIESWALSKSNDVYLVIDTIKKLKRKNFILHSDHGSQYSSGYFLNCTKHKNFQTSMGRVGNSLDNREVEYFFGCLKSEYLKNIPTWKMNLEEIKKHISWYIDWYNNQRIQRVLKWKTPIDCYSRNVIS